MKHLRRRYLIPLVAQAILFSSSPWPVLSGDPNELEVYFAQLLLRDGAFPLQTRECDPGTATESFPPAGELQRSAYQLVRKMQGICDRLDQSVAPRLLAGKPATAGATQELSQKEVDSLVESLVRAHTLMKLAASIIRYDDLYFLHSQIINDTLRRFTYPKDLEQVLQNYRFGFENQNVFELYTKLVQRYDRYRNDAVRMKIIIERPASGTPLNQIGLVVANEGTASFDARLFGESLSLQLCQPIVTNYHLKHYLGIAADRTVNLTLTDYFFIDPSDLAKVRFVEEMLKQFQQEPAVILKDSFSDPRLAVGGATGEHELREYGCITIPAGRYYVYTRDAKIKLPVQPNFVVEPAPAEMPPPGVIWRIEPSGSGVTVESETIASIERKPKLRFRIPFFQKKSSQP